MVTGYLLLYLWNQSQSSHMSNDFLCYSGNCDVLFFSYIPIHSQKNLKRWKPQSFSSIPNGSVESTPREMAPEPKHLVPKRGFKPAVKSTQVPRIHKAWVFKSPKNLGTTLEHSVVLLVFWASQKKSPKWSRNKKTKTDRKHKAHLDTNGTIGWPWCQVPLKTYQQVFYTGAVDIVTSRFLDTFQLLPVRHGNFRTGTNIAQVELREAVQDSLKFLGDEELSPKK